MVWVITIAVFLATVVAALLVFLIVSQKEQIKKALQERRKEERTKQVVVMDVHMPDDWVVSSHEIKSLLDTSESRLIAISFWNDQGTQALAESLGAVALLDKMKLFTELIPAIKAGIIQQRSASA